MTLRANKSTSVEPVFHGAKDAKFGELRRNSSLLSWLSPRLIRPLAESFGARSFDGVLLLAIPSGLDTLNLLQITLVVPHDFIQRVTTHLLQEGKGQLKGHHRLSYHCGGRRGADIRTLY